jgi:hypothetical protein
MKLEPGQTVVIGKRVYKGEIPDGVAKNAGIKLPEPKPSPKVKGEK